MRNKKPLINPLSGLLGHIRYTALAYLYAPFTFFKRVLLCRDKNSPGRRLFLSRWGFLPVGLLEKVSGRKTVWIDALSGGEVTQIVSFCKELKKELSGYNVILSSNNDYSLSFARKHIPELDYIFDSPWDIGWVAKRVLKKITPSAVIFIEGPYLPVLARCAKKMKIKTVIASAFMRDDWFLHRHYFYRRIFFLNPFRDIDHIFVKSGLDYESLKRSGVPEFRMKLLGNLKFDLDFLSVSRGAVLKLKEELRVRDTEIILVAGSIHPKEEKIVIGAYDFLKNNARYPVRLIVVPRYNHFIPRIIAELDKFGYKHVLRSCLGQKEFSPEDVVIVDTFGELAYLYALSSVIVVGGSFIKRNPCGFGQNIVEPLLNIKPVFFGPYMGQFREITSDILQIYAGAQANSSHQLGENIVNLLNDGGLTKSVLSRMRGIVAENSQSIKTHADLIANLVKNGNGA